MNKQSFLALLFKFNSFRFFSMYIHYDSGTIGLYDQQRTRSSFFSIQTKEFQKHFRIFLLLSNHRPFISKAPPTWGLTKMLFCQHYQETPFESSTTFVCSLSLQTSISGKKKKKYTQTKLTNLKNHLSNLSSFRCSKLLSTTQIH